MEGFPGGSAAKKLTANARDVGSTPGLGRSPGEENGSPLQYSCLGNPMARSLAGYSPWSHQGVGPDLVTKQQHKYKL